jgi:hypothetical protein
MSNAVEERVAAELAEADVCCANCGAAEVDDIKLEECDGCDLVKYCGDKCRDDHREQHEEECKNRRVLLHDRKLFTQPDGSYLGECPLCFLPMPIDPLKSMFWTCCSETVCMGCIYANCKSNLHDEIKARRCPFCREVADKEESRKRMMKRVEANDPVALCQMGGERYDEGDYVAAFEYWAKAAELGDSNAQFHLGLMYVVGKIVEGDMEKAVYHLEKAAIGGHSKARNMLAQIEEKNGNSRRAVKHHVIAANLGLEESMKALWKHYSLGYITKQELDATLRSHQNAIDEMKSEQRDAAEASSAVSS